MKIPENSSKTLLQVSLNLIKSIGKKAIDEVKIVKALDSYVDNYIKRFGQIKVLGMPEPISLNNIYTTVSIVQISYKYQGKDIDDLEASFRLTRQHVNQKRESGIAIANEKNRLNVLGAPGSGKSTFLKYLGIEAFKMPLYDNSYIHDCIPVLIELKRFRNEDIDLEKIIQNEFEIAGFPESKIFINRALKEGMLLILLDGLDEVPTAFLNQTIEHIKDFTDKYSKNRFVTSCRTAFYKTYLKDFTDVEIASFDDDQIMRFITNWFNKPEDNFSDISQRFIELLFNKSNQSALELARTPLLLTFLCLTFDESQKFPANRSGLYKRALMILLDKWAAEKRIHNEDIHENLSSEIEIEMLAEISANFFKDDKFFFYDSELKGSINLFLENTLNAKHLPVSKIIEAIEIQQGLLVQRAPEIYSFSHQTIQEYLTAHYYNTPKKTHQLIETYIFDKKWREVFLLLAGMSTSDDLLSLMTEYLKRYEKTDILLSETINWVNKLIPKSDDFEIDACKRVFVASQILSFKRYDGYTNGIRLEYGAITLINAISNDFAKSTKISDNINTKEAIKIIDIISSWKTTKEDLTNLKDNILKIKPTIPIGKMLHGGRHKHRKLILQPFYEYLEVDEKLSDARRNKYKALQNYIDGYILLIECKEASLRVSKEAWKNSCSSIFKIK